MEEFNEKINRLNRLSSRYPSQSKLQMYRNLCFSAAGVCLVVILVVFQSGEDTLPLTISIYSASISIPLWLAYGSLYEFYILIGPRSYSHFRNRFNGNWDAVPVLVAGTGLIATVGGVLYQIRPLALYLFLGAGAVGMALIYLFSFSLSDHIFGDRERSSD